MSVALVLSGGGPLAVAWEWGLLAGLAREGLALRPVNLILGTSAGAIVGAQLAAGRDPACMANAILAEADGVPPPGAWSALPIAAVMKLPELFAQSQAGAAGRQDVGKYAASAPAIETEAAYVERMARAIGHEDWPDLDLGLVAVDIADGETKILRRESGAPLSAAVAASCCLPGLSPPVTIAGRRYVDGGLRSAANADLVSGVDSVVVLAFHPPGPSMPRMLARLAAQVQQLQANGVDVHVVTPDESSLLAIGPRTMDVARRPAVVRAALTQGAASCEVLSTFWRSATGR